MKILVTGHKGFIGSHLMEIVKDANGIDLLSGENILTFSKFSQYDYIFHLAAKRGVSDGEKNPEVYINTNCWGSVRLFEESKNAKKIINVSSSSAEGAKSIYGCTKKFVENVAKKYPNVITIRPYNVFGEGQPLESGAVIPQFINAMLRDEIPIIYGSGEQRRDFTYVRDLVEYLKWLMFDCENIEDEKDKNGIIHAGYGYSVSILDILKSIYSYLPERIYRESREFEILNSQSPMAIKQVYGRDEGLVRTIEWWKNK